MSRPHSNSKAAFQFARRDFLRAAGMGALGSFISPIDPLNFQLFGQSGIPPLSLFATGMILHGGLLSRETATRRDFNSADPILREVGVPVFPDPTKKFPLTSSVSIAMEPLANFLRDNGNGKMVLNEILDHRWFEAGLIPYLNIFHNFYIPWYYGHGYAVVGSTLTGHNPNAPKTGPHLSQVVGQSPLYAPLINGGLRNPLLVNMDSARRFINRDNLNSDLEPVARVQRTGQVFQQTIGVLENLASNGNVSGISRLLDEVRVLKSHDQVSPVDLLRLAAHENRLISLLSSMGGCSLTAGLPSAPPAFKYTDWGQDLNGYRTEQAQLMASYMARAARDCSRPLIVNMNPGHFVLEPTQFGGFHKEVVHRLSSRPPLDEALPRLQVMQDWVGKQMSRSVFELALALKNTPTGDGKNLLDHSLIVIGFEAGTFTHNSRCLTLYTIGGAGGRLKCGFYVDATQPNQSYNYAGGIMNYPLMSPALNRKGLPFVNFLNTICRAAGLPPERYEVETGKGFFRYGHEASPPILSSAVLSPILNI